MAAKRFTADGQTAGQRGVKRPFEGQHRMEEKKGAGAGEGGEGEAPTVDAAASGLHVQRSITASRPVHRRVSAPPW